MKKVLISFVLALLPVLESGASVKIGSLYYNLDTNKKTAEVASYQEDKYEGDITIPAEISYHGTTYRVAASLQLSCPQDWKALARRHSWPAQNSPP